MLAPALYGMACYGMTPSDRLRIKTNFYIGTPRITINYIDYDLW